MKITRENGDTEERVFTGEIRSLEDIDKLFKEVRAEFNSREGWDRMFLDIWEQTKSHPRITKRGRVALTQDRR